MLVPEFSYYINLVLWYLKLLLVLSFPVVGYVIRRKWLYVVVKEAEIKRLMLLAAEEAARAEYEAQEVGYYADDDGVKVNNNRAAFGNGGEGLFVPRPEVVSGFKSAEVVNKCAVCLTPTTTKCARCKSVRYCSAKCQFFHWREGHKDQCHPPSSVAQTFDAESYQHFKEYNEEKAETSTPAGSVKIENGPLKQSHTHLEGGAFCYVGHPEKLQGKCDKGADVVKDVKPSNSTSSISSRFSSGSSSSIFNSDSSDDASIPESSGSSDPEKSIGCQLANASITKSANEIKPLVVQVGTVTARSNLIGRKIISGQCISHRTSSSLANGSDPLIAESGVSDYWEGSLGYSWSDSVKTKCPSPNDGLAGSGSSMQHATTSHGKNKNNGHGDGKPHLSFSGINELSNKAASFKKTDSRSSEVIPIVSNSKTLNCIKEMDIGVFNNSGGSEVKNSVSANMLSHHSADRVLSGSDHKSKPRRSSASNGDGTLCNSKVNNVCQANDVHLTRNVCDSTSTNSSEKVTSSVTKFDVGKHNSKAATSDKKVSLKVANSLETSTWKAVDHFKASNMSRPRCCRADKRHGNKGLFSYELFNSLYGWNQFELRPRGLVNCGNSCYANAVLQCLSFTPPLTAYLLQRLHSRSCTKKDWCFTCEFENLILKAKDGCSPVSPIGIISQLPKIGSHLSNGREEDAHEFLRYVVDAMQSICMKEAINKFSGTAEEEATLIGLTFGGFLQSKIRCLKCSGKSERPERIMDLSVEIEGSIGSLDAALKRFTNTEILDAENKYNCARCKSYQKAKKKLTVLEAPNILTIALKRFQVGKFGKLNKWIDFPEVLDMTPYMSRASDDKAPVYKLYGVIVHLDTMNATFSGHYVCYVKNIQNKWFMIDDSVVKTVEFGTVKKQAAYMLFYARCLPRAPKFVREKFSGDSKAKAAPLLTGHLPFASCPNSPNFNQTISCSRRHVKFEIDSFSDDSSLFSSCSGYSCSTDSSTKESNSVDDLTDLIFGDSAHGLRFLRKSSLDSGSSSPSSSPLCPGNHHSYHQPHIENSGGIKSFCSDPSNHYRNVDCNSSNSINVRHQEMQKLTNVDNVRYGVPSRRFFSR